MSGIDWSLPLDHLEDKCPNLKKRMDEDEAKGKFNPLWGIAGKESLAYMSALAGREIRNTESLTATWDEIEEKLKPEE